MRRKKLLLLSSLAFSLVLYSCTRTFPISSSTGEHQSISSPTSSPVSSETSAPVSSNSSSSSISSDSSSFADSSTSSSTDSSSSTSEPLPPDEDGVITIYSINDFHGKIQQDDGYNGIVAMQGAILSDVDYEDTSLVISSGDMWQGSYISGYDYGLSTTLLMNGFPFASMTLGNHEFDWGVETIQNNMKEADFPFLCANLVYEGTKQRVSWIKDHVILEIEGHKLGIVGAIGADLESDIKISALEGYEFSDSINLLESSYYDCLDEGAEAVILSLHDDQDSDYTNRIQRSNIDFLGIFGGHSHKFQNESGRIPYVQGGSDSRGYSYMRIDLNKNDLVDIGYRKVESSMSQYATLSFLEEVEALIAARPVVTIGYIEGYWTKEKTAKLVVKAMFEAVKKQFPDRDYDESNLIAVHNTGGVRGTFPYSPTSLPITMNEIQIVSPFNNTLYLLPDKTIRASGLEGFNYCYPEASTLNNKQADIIIIDYLLDKYNEPMYDSTGGEQLMDEDGMPYIIYDVVADYIHDNSSIDDPLSAEDF